MADDLKILDRPDWDEVDELSIDKFCWDYEFKPLSKAKLFILRERGICVRMWSYENNPVSVHREKDSYVYQDSCLEFFFNAFPEESQIYLNFEVNHRGVMFVQYGTERNDRQFLSVLNAEHPEVRTFSGSDRLGDFWGIEYEIPLDMLQIVYGKKNMKAGQRIKAGFYKCGDNTGRPHYGSWKNISTANPDFHCPQFFGALTIK